MAITVSSNPNEPKYRTARHVKGMSTTGFGSQGVSIAVWPRILLGLWAVEKRSGLSNNND
jgi:hypothetical protein